MPLVKYILLALLGSSGATFTSDVPVTTTLGADAIAQPNGSGSLADTVGQRYDTKKDGGKLETAVRRKGRRHKHHPPKNTPNALTVKQKIGNKK